MSSRVLLRPQVVIDKAATNTNVYSLVTNCNMISLLSYSINWENGVNGTIIVEACNDYVNPVGVQDQKQATGSWVAVPLLAPLIPAGLADTALIEVKLASFVYVRLKFTDTSGGANTGKLSATIGGKVS